MAQRIGSFEWQKAVCSKHGPSSSTVRLILMVVSLHMDPDGGNAWPSQDTIAERAGVSRKSVVTHLGTAVNLGWLRRYNAGRTKQDWRLNGYEATVPDGVCLLLKRGERPSPPRRVKRDEGRSPPPAEGDEPGRRNVMKVTPGGGERVSHYLPLLTSPITKEGAASPSPADAVSAAQTPLQRTDAELRSLVRTLRTLGWSDHEILEKHAKNFGMTSVHLEHVHAEHSVE